MQRTGTPGGAVGGGGGVEQALTYLVRTNEVKR